MIDQKYVDFAVEETMVLLAIDSPSGYTEQAARACLHEFQALGFEAWLTGKGGVVADLGGADEDDALWLEAHLDTLGGMVSEIKGNGRLRISPLGGLNPNNAEAENCRVVTKFDGVYEGTLQLDNASIHVNGDYSDTVRKFSCMEVVLDEDVKTADVGILLGLAKYLHDEGITPKRRVYVHVTVYEEVGHGGSASVPAGVTEAISVDMGCVGDGLSCTEKQVSICAKDSGGPYSYDVVKKLMAAAKREGADYAVDVYPRYGSDVEATLRAGYDIRHGLIGAGVYASHGYERSHRDGVKNTLLVLKGYLEV